MPLRSEEVSMPSIYAAGIDLSLASLIAACAEAEADAALEEE